MGEILKSGKALYEVNHRTKTYRYFGRNPEKVSKEEEEETNKREIDGFTRLFSDGRTKIFKYKRQTTFYTSDEPSPFSSVLLVGKRDLKDAAQNRKGYDSIKSHLP